MLGLHAQRFQLALTRNSFTIRAARDAIIEARDPAGICRRTLARLGRYPNTPGRFAVFGDGPAPRCLSHGFAPPAAPPARDQVGRAGDPARRRHPQNLHVRCRTARSRESPNIGARRSPAWSTRRRSRAISRSNWSRATGSMPLRAGAPGRRAVARGRRRLPLRQRRTLDAAARVGAAGDRDRIAGHPDAGADVAVGVAGRLDHRPAAAAAPARADPERHLRLQARRPRPRSADRAQPRRSRSPPWARRSTRSPRRSPATKPSSKSAVARQTRLVREVHHRVKNNLQVVASLLNLHSRGSANEEVAAAYASIQRRVDALAVVHRNHYAELEANRGVALKPLALRARRQFARDRPGERRRRCRSGSTSPPSTRPRTRRSRSPSWSPRSSSSACCAAPSMVSVVLEAEGAGHGAPVDRGRRAAPRPSSATQALADRFDRIVTGLARQLRSALDRDPARGRYSVAVGIVEGEA